MPLTNLQFLHAGWCRQSARLAGASVGGWMRFYAVFVYFEHPMHGGCLIDTGYSEEFFRATQPFPARLYRWITPVDLGDPPGPLARLSAAGIDPASVRQIFVSHFHADHVAGLKSFPKAKFIYRPEAYHRLQSQSVGAQVRHGFLRDLLPDDFVDRGLPLEESRFSSGTLDTAGTANHRESRGQASPDSNDFRIGDYWGDGSLLLVDLPGHADGHYGFVLQTAERRVFYIVDACWILEAMMEGRRLPWISRRFQHDETAYFATQDKLRRLGQTSGLELVACHCPQTLKHVPE